MSYEVRWLRRAEQDLTRIWLASRQRSRVEFAAESIDQALRRDAMRVGESRSQDDIRVVIAWPLSADVQVNVTEQRCVVVRIRAIN